VARILCSETIKEIIPALSKVQGAIENIEMDAENPHFKSRYATLGAIREASRKPLAENGLAVWPSTQRREDGLWLVTTLLHPSGEWLAAEWPIPGQTPQQMGSALTYARRYTLGALLNLASEVDDDGNEASKETPKPKRTTVRMSNNQPLPPLVDRGSQSGVDRPQSGVVDPPYDRYLEKIDRMLGGHSTLGHVDAEWQTNLWPKVSNWPPEFKKRAIALYSTHCHRVSATGELEDERKAT
jgi:hypothetical protein